MTRLTFGYSDSEDRIWLSSSDGRRYWLTRRLLAGLLGPVCEVLERTVPGGDIPNALPAARRIALEHAEALADGPEGQPALALNQPSRTTGAAPAPPPALVSRLTCEAQARRCALIVTAGGEPARIDLNRMDFHRLLAALYRVTTTAGWGLAGLPGWLTGRLES